jgi:Flp pilus assembly pilin Flp
MKKEKSALVIECGLILILVAIVAIGATSLLNADLGNALSKISDKL